MYFEIVGSKTVDISNKKQIRTIDIYRSKSLIKPSNSGVLIQGNNLDIMISLLDEYKGKINLIYIDPPYLTGLDFKTRGGSFAYSDKFTREQYYQMMYDRLLLMKELLSDNGSIYVHVDHRTSAHVRLLMDEIFGVENFRNEIIWSYRSGGASKKFSIARKHDAIFLYSKSKNFSVNILYERQYLTKSFMDSKQDSEGRYYVDTILRDVLEGEINIIENDQVKKYNLRPVLNLSTERLGYPTQKPIGLLYLLLKIASNKNDVVADFFCGSGTTVAAAQKLNRNWLGVDLGDESIKVIKERMISLDATFEFKSL